MGDIFHMEAIDTDSSHGVPTWALVDISLASVFPEVQDTIEIPDNDTWST